MNKFFFAACLLTTSSVFSSMESQKISYKDWLVFRNKTKCSHELIIFDDGTETCSKIEFIPSIAFGFGKIGFHQNEVAALTFFDNEKMQIITVNGEVYIGNPDKMLQKNIRTVIFPNNPEKWQQNTHYLTLRNGDHLPIKIINEKITLADDTHQFSIFPKEIVEVTYQGALEGVIKSENGGEKRLRKSQVKDPHLEIYIAKNGQIVHLPWNLISRIQTVSKEKNSTTTSIGAVGVTRTITAGKKIFAPESSPGLIETQKIIVDQEEPDPIFLVADSYDVPLDIVFEKSRKGTSSSEVVKMTSDYLTGIESYHIMENMDDGIYIATEDFEIDTEETLDEDELPVSNDIQFVSKNNNEETLVALSSDVNSTINRTIKNGQKQDFYGKFSNSIYENNILDENSEEVLMEINDLIVNDIDLFGLSDELLDENIDQLTDKEFDAMLTKKELSSNKRKNNNQIEPGRMAYVSSNLGNGFYIDTRKVSNKEYQRFVKATNYSHPTHWINGKIPSGQEDMPVVNVSYQDALVYAVWAGHRLPTKNELNLAMRQNFLVDDDLNEWTSSFYVEEDSRRIPFSQYRIIHNSNGTKQKPLRNSEYNEETGFRTLIDGR